ncbi:ABC transporter substrate-binding protein, partial [Amycolatopsis sp. NPDC059021]
MRLLSALVGGGDRSLPGNPNFSLFEQAFTDAGFDLAHIDDGWAVNGHDALITVSTALRTLPSGKPVQRSQVNTAISGFSSSSQSVPGAGGLITFDNSGNRTDNVPFVRVCPLPPAAGTPPSSTTVTIVTSRMTANCS